MCGGPYGGHDALTGVTILVTQSKGINIMGRSLEFVAQNINTKNLLEYKFDEFINQKFLKNNFINNVSVYWLDAKFKNVSGKRMVTLYYDEDGDFEYFISESCVCDGSPDNMEILLNKILDNILNCRTFNKLSIPEDYENNYWDYDVKYTVGNFVLQTEKLSSLNWETPTKNIKFTAMLPIKCEWIKK